MVAHIVAVAVLLQWSCLLVCAGPLAEVVKIKDRVLLDSVLGSDDPWLIGVSSRWKCKKCKRMKKQLNAIAATSFKDVYRFGHASGNEYIDGEDGDDIQFKSLFKIKSFPKLILFPYGPKQIRAAIVLEDSIVKEMMKKEKGLKKFRQMLADFLPSLVQPLNRKNREGKLQMNIDLNNFFRDKDRGLKRVLLLSKSKKISPMFKKLSLLFDRRFVFGYSHDKVLAKRFGVEANELPQLLVSPTVGRKLKKCTRKTIFRGWQRLEYEQKLDFHQANVFLHNLRPYAPLPYVGDPASFNRYCLDNPAIVGGNGLCIIGVLQFGDYQGSQEVEAMQEVVTRSILRTAFGDGRRGSIRAERMPLAFMWMHGELQEEFEDALKISSLPAVVALNHRKKYYSIFTGALPLEPDHVHKFVFDQLSGGVRLVRLDPNLNISSLISTKQFGTDEEVWETLKSQASGQEL